jgi:hypothetical protein
MSSLILAHQGNGTMRGILVDTTSQVQRFDLGDYTIEAKLAEQEKPDIAGGLIIQLGPQEFIVAGKALDIFFISKDSSMRLAVDAVDEGTFENENWIPKRRLNGDEVHASTWSGTGIKLPFNRVSIQKISLYSNNSFLVLVKESACKR